MTPHQIKALEAEYIRRAREDEAAGNGHTGATWRLAAAMLTVAAHSKGRRRFKAPLDLRKVAG